MSKFLTNNKPVVSVVIPTYNSWATLRLCLKALLRQDYPSNAFEVIVVDDGSTDGTRKKFKDMRFPPSFIYFYQENSKPAAARNLGIKYSSGRYVLFLDADVIPQPNLIQAHVSRHLGFDKVLVEGKVVPILQSPPNRSQFRTLEILKARRTGKLEFTCITWNLSVRKEDICRAGFFNEDFVTRGFEDFELGYRLCKNLGLQPVYEEKAVALNANNESLETAIQKAWENGISFARFVRLHPDVLTQKKWPKARRNFNDWMRLAKSFSPVSFPAARRGVRTLQQLIDLCKGSDDPACLKTLSHRYKEFLYYSLLEGTYTALMGLSRKGPLCKQEKFKPEDYLCRISVEIKAPARIISSPFFPALVRSLNKNGFNVTSCKVPANFEIYLTLPDAPSLPTYKIRHSESGEIADKKIAEDIDEIWVSNQKTRKQLRSSGIPLPVHILPPENHDQCLKKILYRLFQIAKQDAKKSKEYQQAN